MTDQEPRPAETADSPPTEPEAAPEPTATGRGEEDVRRSRKRMIQPRRPATPEEVANMVVYVCSPQASATTGAALRVDGGVVRAIA